MEESLVNGIEESSLEDPNGASPQLRELPTLRILYLVPHFLVGLRALLGPILLWSALDGKTGWGFLGLVALGFLSDVFDGVVARRLGTSTAGLRQADSWADIVFYICIAVSGWIAYPALLSAYSTPIIVFALVFVVWWIVNLARYGRPCSYHTYLSKIWGFCLLALIIALFGFEYVGIPIWLAIIVGIASYVEDILITCVLPNWTHDVPSLFHALRLRQAVVAECRTGHGPFRGQAELSEAVSRTVTTRAERTC
jgi:CDP-diacylglycerol--glycerol-3-phosphate 3-phosphatidyltransferase